MTGRSQTAQQLRLLGGELLIAENPLRVQLGELLYGGEYVCLAGDRLSADGSSCTGAAAGYGTPPTETTGRLATATKPCWLANVRDAPRDCCCEKPLIW